MRVFPHSNKHPAQLGKRTVIITKRFVITRLSAKSRSAVVGKICFLPFNVSRLAGKIRVEQVTISAREEAVQLQRLEEGP